MIAVDSNDPHDAVIANIDLPPRNAKGLVEATAKVVILRPVGGGDGTLLLLELPNCGCKLWPMLSDDTFEASAQRLEAKARAVPGCRAPKSRPPYSPEF